MTTIDGTTAAVLGGTSFALFAVLYIWTALGLSGVFGKSGERGWKAWVPVLNIIVLLQLGGLPGWLVAFLLLPVAGVLVVWVALILAAWRINNAFGHGAGMTVLAALLFPVWASVLGFGPARWLGPDYRGGPSGAGPRRSSSLEDTGADYLQRAAPLAYSPSTAFSAAPAGGWTPSQAAADPPVLGRTTFDPPSTRSTPDWGEFDLGAVSEVTSEVTGADDAAPAPISAVRSRPAADPPRTAPVAASIPSSPRAPAPREAALPPVTRVPSARPTPAETDPWAPPSTSGDPEEFPETSGEVSAIVAAPDAGTPRSARASVSAMHTKAEIPQDPTDETIITRRRRTSWSLIASGAAVPLTSEVVLLGRRPSPGRAFAGAQLVFIDDGTVSKTHARLELRDDRWYVTDLDSTNGVLFATLMGTEVEAPPGVEMEAGERFFLGDAEVRLKRSDP